jgi:hypothetical protein
MDCSQIKRSCRWSASAFSRTILLFYGALFLSAAVVFVMFRVGA